MSNDVIRTEALSKRYGKLAAVDDLGLSVPSGCVFALMGRNGAGKTSLIRMLLGLTAISSGEASVLGLDSRKEHVAIRRRVGYVPEEHHLYRWMTVAETAHFVSAFFPTWNASLCAELLERFALAPDSRVSNLSRGMVAKLALTLALAHEPELLVLDEPTSGLDAVVRREFLESIVGVAGDEGRTVVISSHLLNDVERVVDRVALLDEGRLRLVEDMETLRERVREIRITFEDTPPDTDVALPDVVSLQKRDREWVAVTDAFGSETLQSMAAALPSCALEPRRLTMEEIFVALTRDRLHH